MTPCERAAQVAARLESGRPLEVANERHFISIPDPIQLDWIHFAAGKSRRDSRMQETGSLRAGLIALTHKGAEMDGDTEIPRFSHTHTDKGNKSSFAISVRFISFHCLSSRLTAFHFIGRRDHSHSRERWRLGRILGVQVHLLCNKNTPFCVYLDSNDDDNSLGS